MKLFFSAVHITKATKELLLGDYNIVEANSEDPILVALGQPTYYILPDKTSLLERTASIYNRKMMHTAADGSNTSKLTRVYSRVSFKSKVSKVAEYWGAETPFASLSRPASTEATAQQPLIVDNEKRHNLYPDSSTVQSLTLIENNLASYTFSSIFELLKCARPTVSGSGTPFLLFPFKFVFNGIFQNKCH
ncbi:unnamed protein product [Gongylonema pulchrum]|uniref:Uncharacterized protein n=1 Tax=Gongylonema pulchrum TaxID=637853 RepID=A0A183D1W1_9BILA|nr:unnamed protein product [Gongylonema pulchrum]